MPKSMRGASIVVILYSFLVWQCEKVEPSQVRNDGGSNGPGTSRDSSGASGGVGSDSVKVQTIGSSGCSTWVCLTVGEDFSKQWISSPSFQSVGYGASVSDAPNVYMGGGTEEGDYNGGLDLVYNFNLNSLQFDWIQNLSLGRSHLSAAAVGQKVIFAGGKNENGYNRGNPHLYDVVDIFDKQSGERTTAKLSQPRAHIATATVGSKAFFIGGLVSVGAATGRVDIYNAADGKWTYLEAPRPRAFAGAVAAKGKIYIAGGLDPANPGKQIFSVDILDTETGSWSKVEAPHAHPHASVVIADGNIFVAGGDGLKNGFVDIFNLLSGVWTSAEISDGRYDMAVAVMTDRIVFLGGSFSNAIDIYQIDQKKWTSGTLNVGVDGVVAGTSGGRSVFCGFMFMGGNASASVMWVLNRAS